MNVALDAFPLTARTASGIPNYLRNTLAHLMRLEGEDRYFLYCRNPVAFQEGKRAALRSSPRATERSTSYGNTLWLFTQGVRLMKRDGIDLFWGPRHMLPPLLPRGMKTVLTVHDLVWRFYPETMERYNLLVMKLLAERSIRVADHIIAVSRATANSLAEMLHVPEDKVSVVHHAADRYVPLDKEDAARFIAERYGTERDYVLTVSTVEPRKNLPLLLRVFARLEGPQLLVAGASGWKTSSLHEQYRELGLTEERVKFLGYVPDEDMNRLYSGARLFVFPSLYEGFGMPPLEAMASGTPVICSRSSSLPEVVGEAGLLLEPGDEGAWRQAIAGTLSDGALRQGMADKGLRQARLFSWEKSARETLRIFQRLA